MNNTAQIVLKRILPALLLACGVGGCAVYGPPPGPYDPYYYGYGYGYGPPVYAAPPISLGLDFHYYDYDHGYWGGRHGGYHGWHHGYRGGSWQHGWRGH